MTNDVLARHDGRMPIPNGPQHQGNVLYELYGEVTGERGQRFIVHSGYDHSRHGTDHNDRKDPSMININHDLNLGLSIRDVLLR